jgi:hypothetical protein
VYGRAKKGGRAALPDEGNAVGSEVSAVGLRDLLGGKWPNDGEMIRQRLRVPRNGATRVSTVV